MLSALERDDRLPVRFIGRIKLPDSPLNIVPEGTSLHPVATPLALTAGNDLDRCPLNFDIDIVEPDTSIGHPHPAVSAAISAQAEGRVKTETGRFWAGYFNDINVNSSVTIRCGL